MRLTQRLIRLQSLPDDAEADVGTDVTNPLFVRETALDPQNKKRHPNPGWRFSVSKA